MKNIHETVALYLFLTCAVLYLSVVNGDREELIEDSVRRLLGFKPGINIETLPLRKNITLPPRYMMDMYEKYRSGQTPMQGNTVRSILPMRDNMGEADVLIFNLTGISSSERILQGKLYILKRKRPRNNKRRDASHFRMKIGTLPNMTFHRYIDVSLSRQKSEWQSYDITNSVLHCRRTSQKKDSLLGITLEVKRAKHNYRLSPFRRLLRQSSQPFLLIFSEDDNSQARHSLKSRTKGAFDAIQDLLTAKSDNIDQQTEDLPSISKDTSFKIRTKRSSLQIKPVKNVLEYKDPNSSKTDPLTNNSKGYSSIGDSSIHEDDLLDRLILKKTSTEKVFFENDINPFNSLLHLFHSIHQQNLSKNSLIHKLQEVLTNFSSLIETFLNDSSLYSNETSYKGAQFRFKRSISNKLAYSTVHKEDFDATANTFQTVDEKTDTPKTSRKNKKKLKKKRRNRKLPFWWTNHEAKLHSQEYKKMCQRRSLVVDFIKLGWGDWVMSPKSFNAHYCTGGCTFPLIKDTDPSNHAALQSLIHALGLNSGIPTPCCVPSSTSPLTLLYFDEHGSLVLKNYPNMIVNKCACR